MKFDKLMNMRIRRRPGDEEHRIQCSCVRWFRMEYPELRRMLFAVPNGGRRDAVTGQKLKDEGATSGVADLILLRPNRCYGCLAIEMKKPGGRQAESQKEWQADCERYGNRYVVCHSLDEFIDEVNSYLKDV